MLAKYTKTKGSWKRPLSRQLLALVILSMNGCDQERENVLKGPCAIDGSGDYFFCRQTKDGKDAYCVVDLAGGSRKTMWLPLEDSVQSLGVAWKPNHGSPRQGSNEEFFFLTSTEPQEIHSYSIDGGNIIMDSSYSLDPNVFAKAIPASVNQNGDRMLLAMRSFTSTLTRVNLAVYSETEESMAILSQRETHYVCWNDSTSFWLAIPPESEGGQGGTINKVSLDPNTGKWSSASVVSGDDLCLSRPGLVGSVNPLIYAKGRSLFRNGHQIAILREQPAILYVDGSLIACRSTIGRRTIDILNAEGEYIFKKTLPEGSKFLGLSSKKACIFFLNKEHTRLMSCDIRTGEEVLLFDVLDQSM